MNKLIATAVLALAFGFFSLSSASDHMELYTKPVVESEVSDVVKGGDVESDFISFYITPKTADSDASVVSDRDSDDDESYIVFGVRIFEETAS